MVKDEPFIVIQVKRPLEPGGAEVAAARQAEAALGYLAPSAFDAAILDVNLGHEKTCEPVAENLRTRSIPFCLFSGDLQGAGELVSLLGAPLIRKPANDRTILAGVSNLLR